MDSCNFVQKLRKHRKGKDTSRLRYLLQEASLSPSLHADSQSLYIPSTGLSKSFPVKALFDFTATQPDECSFGVGDLLNVLAATSDWWLAINLRTKQRGLIPHNYVTSDMSLSNVLGDWFDVDRMGAERKLLMPGVLSGTYIPRPCETETIDGELSLIKARPRRVAPPLSFKDCFIHYEDVKLEEELGRGDLGVVYRGRILSMEVAIKQSLDIKNNQAFREEAEVMQKLSHQRIMRFLGFCCDCPDNRVLIITEFMANGALCAYLKTTEGRRLNYHQLISIIGQVVKGMVYLEKVGVVHRDLRAANVLVDADGSVKIADFGLTKILDFSQNFTEAMKRGHQPDTKADVWSFGVLMFEVLTYGKTPFEEYGLSQLVEFLSKGGRLSSPRLYGFECDKNVYAIMRSCWNAQPEKRSSFKEISHEIEHFIEVKEGAYEACWEKMVEN